MLRYEIREINIDLEAKKNTIKMNSIVWGGAQ
jgi:hypothetical protein